MFLDGENSEALGPAATWYEELVACRDVFHCTPSELDDQDDGRVQTLLALHFEELAYQAKKRKS